ncbi:dihydrolipoamide acetyltransferase family protein [Chitinophaga cymbidii]|uniref:Dihydrolipoamide acetyltransferase component of pyruvate dehydrogenase complex n=1 Tax=Chitinophaga cymbidii TaxID=1096750 RepID=A0A512RT51_9BACT|nr:dihydrolipoamide acetyltransferase family protein [Chitinophaga cymbidii]GEP98865.1 dihydrolipoamide acetyltransferase component of pyruvate dehydrogenase complex [Chitinophaga cymbidii]
MAIVELVMPKMGESIMEATILRWHKKPGDMVKVDETVLEIATDKVDSEVPSIAEGEITEILYNENDVVPVGTVIARVRTEADAEVAASPATPPPASAAAPSLKPETQFQAVPAPRAEPAAAPSGDARFYSPLVLTIAQQEGVSFAELEKIPGSGNEGRVTKKDILEYIANRTAGGGHIQEPEVIREAPQVQASTGNHLTTIPASNSYGGNVEIIEMDRMRKLIANHMVQSKQISPHVTSFAEADVTNLVRWRESVKKDFEKREGEKITFMPLFVEAIVKCIKKFPLVNCSLDGDKIILKKDINIGMATALPSGNLIVPVIRNADTLNLVGLTKQVNHLANAARHNRLKPEDTQNGTFTITNVGTFGSLTGTPIINQPQVAILAVGAIKKRPVVVETPQGDSIAIRHMMYLSMSYDHRIVDGSLGSTFLSAVAEELEHFDPAKEY